MSEHEASGAAQRAHSKYGGSVIGRVMACPGSVALCDTVPAEPESSYAAEGTFAHEVAEYCLREGDRDALHMVKTSLPFGVADHGKIITKEIAEAVNVYLKAVYAELDASPNAELYVEHGFELAVGSADPGEVFGTNDAMVYHPDKGRLVVFDYKHGAGVSVSAEDNAQLKFYAAGAALSKPDWPISEVELVIVQPRARDAVDEGHGGVKRWKMDPLDLIEFAGQVDEAVAAAKHAADDMGHPAHFPGWLQTGPHCRWCSAAAAAVCPAKHAQAVAGLGLEGQVTTVDQVTVPMLPDPKSFDVDKLGRILAAKDAITSWLGQIEDYAFGLLQSGAAVPGFKLVEKQARRKWTGAEVDIAAYLTLVHGLDEDEVMPRKLVTITDAEALLKAALIDRAALRAAKDELSLRYTTKDSSGLTIAPIGDKRDAVDAVANAVAGLPAGLAA